MSTEKESETTWNRISHLSLPNQVKALCMCIDEGNHQLTELSKVVDPEGPKATKK